MDEKNEAGHAGLRTAFAIILGTGGYCIWSCLLLISQSVDPWVALGRLRISGTQRRTSPPVCAEHGVTPTKAIMAFSDAAVVRRQIVFFPFEHSRVKRGLLKIRTGRLTYQFFSTVLAVPSGRRAAEGHLGLNHRRNDWASRSPKRGVRTSNHDRSW